MTTDRGFNQRRLLTVYFILTFAISWGAILILAGPDGIPATPDQAVMLGMAMLIGPTVAGILLTGIASGKGGYHDLLSRLVRGRVGIRWYAMALLIAPLTTAVVVLVLWLFSSDFTPSISTSDDKANLVIMGFVAGLMVGIFEELGWTGFAIPMMLRRYSILSTGLIVGLLWGAWHLLLFWESDSFFGVFPFALLIARLFFWLPAYRILMVWVYDRTHSLFVVILMHMSLVATLQIIDPSLAENNLLIFILVRGAALWVIAGVVILANRGRIKQVNAYQSR